MASAGFLLHILNRQLYCDCGIELGEREVSEPGVVRFFSMPLLARWHVSYLFVSHSMLPPHVLNEQRFYY